MVWDFRVLCVEQTTAGLELLLHYTLLTVKIMLSSYIANVITLQIFLMDLSFKYIYFS